MDWQDPHAYRFAESLNAAQWAWEFLRRNLHYRREWQAFIETWRTLEASYGRVGQRDMTAWKRDPRAWVPAAECAESDCRVDGEKVLIECAMGARWGFYKFPPDPADDDPVGGGRLTWRDVSLQLRLLGSDPIEPPATPGAALLEFDLALPLREQLASAKRLLQIEQRNRVRAGLIEAPRIGAQSESLCRLLRLLDGLDAGAEEQRIGSLLFPESPRSLYAARDRALRLRDRDYRRLLLLE